MEKGTNVWRSGVHGFLSTSFCVQLGAFFSDTLAHGYPVAVGVVGFLVGDESNMSVIDEHRVIEYYGS